MSAVVVIGIGLVYMAVHPLHDRSTAPYDDAIPATPQERTTVDR